MQKKKKKVFYLVSDMQQSCTLFEIIIKIILNNKILLI